jgi:hypothetical protein
LLLGARPVRSHAGAPGRGLSVEIVHIDKLASRKEVVADIADGALVVDPLGVAGIAAADDLVDEAAVGREIIEVSSAAQ